MDSDRIVGMTKNVAGKVEGAVGRATGDAKTEASGVAREAEGLIQDAVGQVKDFASQAADAGKAAYEGAGRVVSDRVAERPGSALLVSGLIGLAIGYMLAKGSQPPRRRSYFDRYYG